MLCASGNAASELSGAVLLLGDWVISSYGRLTVCGLGACGEEGRRGLRYNNLSVNRLYHWLLMLLPGSMVSDARRLLWLLWLLCSPVAPLKCSSLDGDLRYCCDRSSCCLRALDGEVDHDTIDLNSSALRLDASSSTLGSAEFLC